MAYLGRRKCNPDGLQAVPEARLHACGMRLSGSGDSANGRLRKSFRSGKLIRIVLCLRWVILSRRRIMKWNRKGHGAFSAVTAGALVLGLSACDQIQSLWKSEEKTNPVAGTVAQPKPAEGTIQVARAVDLPKSIEAPKPPIDENKVLASKIKAALGADPALKFLAIDAAVSDGAVTLYGTANNRALREKAAKVVADVPGVKSVRNELVIVAGS